LSKLQELQTQAENVEQAEAELWDAYRQDSARFAREIGDWPMAELENLILELRWLSKWDATEEGDEALYRVASAELERRKKTMS
jgi:hypothetical protein